MTGLAALVRRWGAVAAAIGDGRRSGGGPAGASAVVGAEGVVELGRLLSGRAALLGLAPGGDRSAGGSARLLRAADGWVALNLARDDDRTSLPALAGLLGSDASGVEDDLWAAAGSIVARARVGAVIEGAALLGLAAAAVPPEGTRPDPLGEDGVRVRPLPAGSRAGGAPARRPVVVDLSSMWAGPLCARLLEGAGARVVKVEHPARPDGARAGDPRFWGWLHDGQQFRTVDFTTAPGRRDLAALIAGADVVIEGSRARALDQLGLGPAQTATAPGAVWVTITGHGRTSPRVAFGDDSAVAGGLVAWDDEGPMFCGDAMGDPVTGLTAAVVVAEALARGGGVHLDVAMAGAVAAAASAPGCPRAGGHRVERVAGGGWEVVCGEDRAAVAPPVELDAGSPAAG